MLTSADKLRMLLSVTRGEGERFFDQWARENPVQMVAFMSAHQRWATVDSTKVVSFLASKPCAARRACDSDFVFWAWDFFDGDEEISAKGMVGCIKMDR
jgi:hypothetical protein